MLNALRQLFGGKRVEKVPELADPVLGTLRLSDDRDCWHATVIVGDRPLGVIIGGEAEPDPALVAHAQAIIQSFPEFERSVSDFLGEEARANPKSAAEIGQLTIEEVMFSWPRRPNDGMIFFKGPDEFRLWHCDYLEGKLSGLAFDD